jgi:hypothetical protein
MNFFRKFGEINKKFYIKVKKNFHIGFVEIFFLVCVIFIYPGPTFYSFDGLYYFAQLISIFEDGDLYLINNLKSFPLEISIRENFWSIGPAIFWSPFYLIGHLLFSITSLIFPSITNLYDEDILIFGLDIALVNIGTIFFVYLGLKILGIALVKFYGDKKFSPYLVQISIFLCTPLIFYTLSRPLMAHGISFFTVCVVIYLWVIWHDHLTKKQIWWISLALGISCLVRWNNVIFSVIFLPQILKTLVKYKNEQNTSIFFKNILFGFLIILGGFLVGFSPQLIAWWMQFGIPLPLPNLSYQIPTNPLAPNLFEVWFGTHGFFIWHPINIIYIVGLILFFFWKVLQKFDGFVLLLGFFLQSYFWGITIPAAAASFGFRGLIGSLPLLALGLSNILLFGYQKINEKKYIITILFFVLIIVLSLMNLYLFFLIGHTYGNPSLTFSDFNIDWFFNLDWVLINKAIIPIFSIEKIIVVAAIAFSVIIFSSLIHYLQIRTNRNEISKKEDTNQVNTII